MRYIAKPQYTYATKKSGWPTSETQTGCFQGCSSPESHRGSSREQNGPWSASLKGTCPSHLGSESSLPNLFLYFSLLLMCLFYLCEFCPSKCRSEERPLAPTAQFGCLSLSSLYDPVGNKWCHPVTNNEKGTQCVRTQNGTFPACAGRRTRWQQVKVDLRTKSHERIKCLSKRQEYECTEIKITSR